MTPVTSLNVPTDRLQLSNTKDDIQQKLACREYLILLLERVVVVSVQEWHEEKLLAPYNGHLL